MSAGTTAVKRWLVQFEAEQLGQNCIGMALISEYQRIRRLESKNGFCIILTGEPKVDRADALIADPGARFDYVLANPPFGKKSTITNAEGGEDRDALTYERQDFGETTSNHRASGSGAGSVSRCGRRVAGHLR